MNKKIFTGLLVTALMMPAAVTARTPAPEGATAYIISPAHGEVVTSPVTIKFGLDGMGVAPAGVDRAKTGHHHLLIDVPTPALDKPMPSDDQHRHFGGGQTETTIDLPAGTHTLQIILGDKDHIPHQPAVMSEKITIEVK